MIWLLLLAFMSVAGGLAAVALRLYEERQMAEGEKDALCRWPKIARLAVAFGLGLIIWPIALGFALVFLMVLYPTFDEEQLHEILKERGEK